MILDEVRHVAGRRSIPKALVASLECHGGLCICMLPAFVPNEALERQLLNRIESEFLSFMGETHSISFLTELSVWLGHSWELQTTSFKWMMDVW